MKFEPNKKYTTIAIYAFCVLVAVILFYEAMRNINSLFSWICKVAGFIRPMIYGGVIAFLLNPLLRRLDDKLLPRLCGQRLKPKHRRVVALIFTYLIMILVVFLFFALLVPNLYRSIRTIILNFSVYFKYLEELYASFTQRLTGTNFITEDTEIAAFLNSVIAKFIESAEGLLESVYEYVYRAIWPLISGATKLTLNLVNLLLGVVVSIYILMDREKLFAQLKKITKALFPDRVSGLLYDIARDANRILSGFVIGKVIDSLIIGCMCFVGMLIFRMEFPVLISVIVGVTNVIPYFGPFIGAIPSLFILLVNGPLVQAIWFLIFIILLQQFDGNILGPKILGDTIGLSPLWIVCSIMLFSGLLGVIGMFIGVPLFAIIYSLLKRFIAFLLQRKGEPTNTREYDSGKNPLIK